MSKKINAKETNVEVDNWFNNVYSDNKKLLENDLFPETHVKNKKDGIEKLETLRSAMIGVLRDMKEHGFIEFNEYDDFIKSNKYLKSKIKKLNKGYK